jgi:hypothetical protein
MNESQTYKSTSNAWNHVQTGDKLQPSQDLFVYAQEYARERPEVVALWCFGIGFVLGWKLKPW